ncbi:MAG: cobalamin biosynthesis protein [Candidatus Hodgkinia cicadicola]
MPRSEVPSDGDNVLRLTTAAAVISEIMFVGRVKWRGALHPLTLMARAAAKLARGRTSVDGFYAWAFVSVVCAVGLTSGAALHVLLRSTLLGWFMEMALVALVLSQRSLFRHADGVMSALYSCGTQVAEHKLNTMIGRRLREGNERTICSATVLSLFENFNDATFLPIFYYVAAGLPGITFVKLVDLLDSMFGNRKHENASIARYVAKLDDLVSGAPFAIISSAHRVAYELCAMVRGRERSFVYVSPKLWVVYAFAKAFSVRLDASGAYSPELRASEVINEGGKPADATYVGRAKLFINFGTLALLASAFWGLVPKVSISP